MKANTENMQGVITVDMFNKLTGQETLHPLVSIIVSQIELLLNYCTRFCSYDNSNQ